MYTRHLCVHCGIQAHTFGYSLKIDEESSLTGSKKRKTKGKIKQGEIYTMYNYYRLSE